MSETRSISSDLHAEDACLTSHVLDASTGRPAKGIGVELFRSKDCTWELLKHSKTTSDGRLPEPLLTAGTASAGAYKIKFQTKSAFWQDVEVAFEIYDVTAHHHVPLVISPFGFSTYRGAPPHRAADGGSPSATMPANAPTGQAAPPGSLGPGVTVHVIDMARGIGAAGMRVALTDPDQNQIADLVTTAEGRTAEWLAPPGTLQQGIFELHFDLAGFYIAGGLRPFFPTARIKFRVEHPDEHYHIPLLVTPWGYSCYRGS